MGSSNLIAGAILIATGAVLSVTGVGLIIGIPLALFGAAVMFPDLAKLLVGLGVGGFVLLYFTALL